MSRTLTFIVATLLLSIPASRAAGQAAEPDAAGCQDHALFTRMQDMRIMTCKTVEFDRFEFKTGKGTTTPVEGRRVDIRYQMRTGKTAPTPIAIIRNHQQAVSAVGGRMRFEDPRYTTLSVSTSGAEVWAQVDTAWGKGYVLTIVEKKAMTQEVRANADAFQSGLVATGHVEVPGIYFDTAKAELKPESDASVGEIAKLLKADPLLKVFVVGHTDNVGSLDANARLSQARAEAVVQALVSRHGIAAARLVGRGVGPLAPIGSNDTEEGRARNRRVELVKQ
jgi:outer membrane protein OmpA-like peptidoglycan-associated protein